MGLLKSFLRYITERAATYIANPSSAQIQQTLAAVGIKKAYTDYGTQFILPNGATIQVDPTDVHARAVFSKGEQENIHLTLIGVMEAGIVRVSMPSYYQVASPISQAQAQTMIDQTTASKYNDDITVSIADADMARRNADENDGVGPIEIDERSYKRFPLDRANATAIRAWVASQFH